VSHKLTTPLGSWSVNGGKGMTPLIDYDDARPNRVADQQNSTILSGAARSRGSGQALLGGAANTAMLRT
jgi:hypothetical protein